LLGTEKRTWEGEDLVKYQPIDSEPSYVKKTNERGESIIIGETVTTTLKDPQGNVRKITTVESYPTETGNPVSKTNLDKNESMNNDKRFPSKEDDTVKLSEYNDIDNIDFSKLENFLHPKSGSLRRIIEERVIKRPKILSEMLSVNFSDLVVVFQDLFIRHKNKDKTLEEIYTELLDFVDKEGSEGIQNYATSVNNNRLNSDETNTVADTGLKNLGVEELPEIMTEEQVISREQKKIQDILHNQFAQAEISKNIISVAESQDGSKVSDEVISRTLDQIKNHLKVIEKTKKTVESPENYISSNEDPSTKYESKSDEL